MSDSIMDLYLANRAKTLDLDVTPEQPVPERRAVAPATAPVQTVQPETVVEHVQQIERFDANIQQRVWKLETTGVLDPRIDELAARIARLEQIVKPALAPATKLSKIELQWAMIQGKTTWTKEQFRCMPKERREQIVEAANG